MYILLLLSRDILCYTLQGFSAPSYDDKLVEVVGITGITQVTTAKVLGIQNQRIAQCRYAKLTIQGQDTVPMQVDGEAWLQEPGIIVVSHKNKARIIFKDKTFSQSLESWKQKNPGSSAAPINVPRPVGVLHYLKDEEVERYLNIARTTRSLMELIRQEGASGNVDVSRDLVPLVASTFTVLDRVFPSEEHISETADLEHLDDFKHEMGALIEKTSYALRNKQVSSVMAERMEECVSSLKANVDIISSRESTSVFRRASDSVVGRGRPTQHPSHSPSAHRERSTAIIPDSALTAAKKIGKKVSEWECDDVCQWMTDLGLKDYDAVVHSNKITGKVLLELQTEDFLDMGIVKLVHLTKLRTGIQALNPSLHSTPGASKRSKQFRDTR